MNIQRREFLKSTAALAAMASLPASFARAAASDTAYPYLGRTEDYARVPDHRTGTDHHEGGIVDAGLLRHRPHHDE